MLGLTPNDPCLVSALDLWETFTLVLTSDTCKDISWGKGLCVLTAR